MKASYEKNIKELLLLLGEDPKREGLLKTPARVARSLEFLSSGYKMDAKALLNTALFKSSNNQMIIVKDIEFYSLCEHHLLPFFGSVHIGYIPNGKVVGLSKIPRLVDLYARRLQIQEQLCEQIAEALFKYIGAKGVGVVIEARHLCMQMRGVQKSKVITKSSALRGLFLKDEKTRREFFALINTDKRSL